jgi:hypothetical protein
MPLVDLQFKEAIKGGPLLTPPLKAPEKFQID